MKTTHKRQPLTITLLCDTMREKVCQWRRQSGGVFATFQPRKDGQRFVDLFPAFAGQTITYTVGRDISLPAAVAEWLFANGYLQPTTPQALWK